MNRQGSVKNPKQVIGGLFILILIVAGVAFDVFNFVTTYDALMMMTGSELFAILAVAFTAIDLGALGRVFTKETDARKEPEWVAYLMIAWLVFAVLNTYFTWYFTAVYAETNANFKAPESMRAFAVTVTPVMIALSVSAARILLFATLGKALDVAINTPKASTYRPTTQPTSQTTSRPQQSYTQREQYKSVQPPNRSVNQPNNQGKKDERNY